MLNKALVSEPSPIYLLEIDKQDCRFATPDEIVNYFCERIEEHPMARFIGVFDHYKHTQEIPNGVVAENIRYATNILLCFGLTLQEPAQLANRPRSIGICETDDQFVISFRETPMPLANALIESWTQTLCASEERVSA